MAVTYSDTSSAHNRKAASTLPAQVSTASHAKDAPSKNQARMTLPASFASHLIASHRRKKPRPARVLAPVNAATNAYDAGQKISVKRLPKGFSLSKDV